MDSILESWADSHGFHIHKIFKDVEVRTIDIVSPKGKRFQLWIDEPDQSGKTTIHVWDMKKRKKDFVTAQSTLTENLELAYQEVQSWF